MLIISWPRFLAQSQLHFTLKSRYFYSSVSSAPLLSLPHRLAIPALISSFSLSLFILFLFLSRSLLLILFILLLVSLRLKRVFKCIALVEIVSPFIYLFFLTWDSPSVSVSLCVCLFVYLFIVLSVVLSICLFVCAYKNPFSFVSCFTRLFYLSCYCTCNV